MTLSQLSDEIHYPVPTILFLIQKARSEGLTIMAHATIPRTTYQFIPPKTKS